MIWNNTNWLLTGTCDEACFTALIESGKKTDADYKGNSNESVFCLEGDLDCYVPKSRAEPGDAETDSNIICFRDFCFNTTSAVDTGSGEDVPLDDLKNNLTLCLDDTCFIV